jgi:hypothetical protein
MMWYPPKDFDDFNKMATVNGSAALAFYFATILCMFVVAPARFVEGHEWIANGKIPFSEQLVKVLAPLLLSTERCLDAVVRWYRDRPLYLFEDVEDVRIRLKWVAAPLVIGEEEVTESRRGCDIFQACLSSRPGWGHESDCRYQSKARRRRQIVLRVPNCALGVRT